MSRVLTNRQREGLYTTHGKPVLALEFDVFGADNKVSMWAHTRHDVSFAEMQAAFEACARHILAFIADGQMCPFNPNFKKDTR